jgi:hypothetical protein
MRYINPNSKSGLINKFADFIVKNTDETSSTIIEVIYLGGFFVIKGVTESDKVLNLQEIRNNFVQKYNYLLSAHGINNINYIDIIEYGSKNVNYDSFSKFYKSETPRFHSEVINYVKTNNLDLNEETIDFDCLVLKNTSTKRDALSLKSEFPHGYNLKSGRLKYYYSEYIVNQIISSINCNQIFIKFNSNKDIRDDLQIRLISDSYYPEEIIKSLVLDVFDFNITKFKNDYLIELDLEFEVENQLLPSKWLVKDKSKDVVIF